MRDRQCYRHGTFNTSGTLSTGRPEVKDVATFAESTPDYARVVVAAVGSRAYPVC